MVLQLRPYVDDGRHYVLYRNGVVERVEPDRKLLERYGLSLTPVVPASRLAIGDEDHQKHVIYAIVRAGAETATTPEIIIQLRSGDGEEDVAVPIDLKSAVPGDSKLVKRWSMARSRRWSRLAAPAPSSALSVWISRQQEIYGHETTRPRQLDRNRNRGRSTTAFGVLGGRAAIRETLQMQALDMARVDSESDRTIAVESIAGVQVKSHPFEKMLGGNAGGSLAIAAHVPIDRFFVYFAKPSALADYLDGGSDFLLQTSRALNGSSLDYDLNRKTLDRLGMNPEWLKLLLKSEAVQEIAMVFPDLFLIDGTEVSVILRIPQIEQLKPLLGLIGVRGLDESAIVEKRRIGTGGRTFWAARGDLLFVSTHRGELKRILSFGDGGGEGSLGRSAEFRYMLTKLAVRDSTRAFAYFSDPFIRRLVGPRVKIAQLRRLQARADLENLTAGALLYRADAREGQPSIERLAELGYVPESLAKRDYRLDENLVASSEGYGTPSDMTSLLEVDVQRVTPGERDAYKAYVTAYSRFWRQFFDPIAIRLDELDSGELELEIFILPLLDSSVYNAVRQILVEGGAGAPLRVPHFEPEPVLMFSANVADKAWTEMADEFTSFYQELGLPLELIDELGPSFHLAILDGDPVLNLGSGDILGGFGMSMQRGWFGEEEMLLVPAILSAFTRPCKILIELRDSERVARVLRQTSIHKPLQARWDFGYDLIRLEDRDAWILTIDILGVANLRLGVEVKDGFLIFSNIPWTEHSRFRGRRGGHLDSILLQVTPGAGALQLPGLFTAAMEKERVAAYQSAGHLLPLMLAGAENVESARAWHRRLFGFTPGHPGHGSFKWTDGMVVSDRFGTTLHQRQPAYEPGDREFGWLRRIHRVQLSLQLEDGGLRTRARWSLRQPPQAASALAIPPGRK